MNKERKHQGPPARPDSRGDKKRQIDTSLDGVRAKETEKLMPMILDKEERSIVKAANSKMDRNNKVSGLLPRMKAFARRYAYHGNGARAAREVGYPARSAYQQAHWLLNREDIMELVALYESRRDLLFDEEVNRSIMTVVEIRDDPRNDAAVRLKAACEILDRAGYGKIDRMEISDGRAIPGGPVSKQPGVEAPSVDQSIRILIAQLSTGPSIGSSF